MHVKPRSYLTAGIAALGVGALALAPVQPIPNQVALNPQRVVNGLGVDLAAAVDPITAWVDTFETTFANIGILGEFYMQNPFPILQTIAANTATYAEEAANGQGDLIAGQIWDNIQTFFQAPWSPGTQLTFSVGPDQTEVSFPAIPPSYISNTKPPIVPPDTGVEIQGNSPSDVYSAFVQFAVFQSQDDECSVDGNCLIEQLAPLLNFTNTPYSAQLLGLLGPVLSPLVQLVDSFTAVGQYFQEGEVLNAVYELINIPANMTNAFLNGGNVLDLTGIIAAIVELPEAFADATFGIRLGGLLNAMPQNGSTFEPAENPPTEFAGGVAFDSLVIDAGLPLATPLDSPAFPNGWLGSTIGLGQFLGEQLLVTPPAPPPVAAQPAAAKQAAPLEIPAPALTEAPAEESAPAVVDIPAEEAAPAVAEVVEEDPAPAVDDTAEVEAVETVAEVEAAVEAVEASAAEPTEVATPAAGDSGPEAAADSDKSEDDTDRSGSNNRRGAS